MSTRARSEGRDTRRLADSLEYGIAVHSYRRRADVLVDAVGLRLVDTVRLSREAFVLGVREAAAPDRTRGDFVILYVHGYGTSLHECWSHASESRIRTRSAAPWVAFCWPSRGSGIAPPSRGAILDGGYVGDSVAAWASKPAFDVSASAVLEAVPPSRVLLVAHSMGAALVGAALRDSTALRARLLAEPARAIAFVSADIAAAYFIDSVVPAVHPLAARTVAYMSARDRMLALSRARSGVPRAGQRSRLPAAARELETIDATAGMVAESAFQRLFGTHHALRRASAVLFDLIHLLGAGRAAQCRLKLGTADQDADNIWTLKPVRPDTSAVAGRCGTSGR